MTEAINRQIEIIPGRAQLADMLTNGFQRFGLGAAGERRRNGTTVSALDVIISWRAMRDRDVQPEDRMTMWQAFKEYIQARQSEHIISREQMLDLSGLWANCYGMDTPDFVGREPDKTQQ